MAAERPEFLAILEVLSRYDVEFIVVGGLAAVILGAPVATFDIDIVHARNEGNLDNLQMALTELDAAYRLPSDRRLVPDVSHLVSAGHHLLRTKFGPLDVLGTVGNARSYEDLLPHTVATVVANRTYRVLDLEHQITIKEEVGQAKDQAILPILHETLARTKRR